MTRLECVANVSEGRDQRTIRSLAAACGPTLLDVHADHDHHRSVFTLAGDAGDVQAGARSLARMAVETLDISVHVGAHPRFGVLDVVPFVPLDPAPAPVQGITPVATDTLGAAIAARDAFAGWAAEELGLPCFLYGPLDGGAARTLPEVRRHAFVTLAPDLGPRAPHPTAGAVAVGARPVLVAYNLWLDGTDIATARTVAASLRGPGVRALAFDLASGIQVSCNLLDPAALGPAEVYDRVASLLRMHAGAGGHTGVIRRAELVGLLPAAVLARIGAERWTELDLSPTRTIESRSAQRAGGAP